MDDTEPGGSISLLNLPEPILECILKRLSPKELVEMSEVCICLRDRCRSDPMWEVHIKQKWGGVIGDVAYKEWKLHITTAKEKGNNQLHQQKNQKGSLGSFNGTWPRLYLRSYLEDCSHLNSSLSNSFMMALYFSLENGKFWFPVQVYRGVSVRDALVRYDSKTDNFQARRQSGRWHIMGSSIQWDNLRAPPVDTPPCVGYVSDCLQDLKPEDHIEIQRRSRTENPYDTLILEFKQYSHGSSMRRVKLQRNGEQYEEPTGCYGGIRKIHNEEEIQRWAKLFPLHQTPVYNNITLQAGFNNIFG